MDAHTEKHVKKKHGKKKSLTQETQEETTEVKRNMTDERPAKVFMQNFDADKFSDQLKLDGSAAFDALSGFLEHCHHHEEDPDSQDVVSSYLQVSPQCSEVMNLLDAEKRPPSENKQIFEVITQILLRITDDLTHHASTAVHLVNRLLRSHIRHIYRALNSSNTAKIITSALKLLAAMVTHSTATAKEVMALYRMDHEGLLLLLNRTDKKAKADVRICVLRFLMAFLITNDGNIVEQLLTHRELMKTIFKNLRQDRLSTLHLILPTMQQYIVCNPSVSKTQKLKLFNDYTLPQIAALYDWQGVNDIQEEDDGKSTVRQLVHGFLLEVTCNHKHGVNFHDKTMGTSGRSHNAALLKFALTQKSVNEDSLRQELVVKILQTCPDVVGAYLSKCSLSFAPRNSRVWQKNMAFVMKIYSSLQVNSIVASLQDTTSTSKMVSMAMVATVPVFMTQAMIVQGLKQGGAIAFTLLELIQSMLSQSQKITEAVKIRCPDKLEFVTAYHGAIQKALPNINTVLPVWQKVLLKWKEEMSATSKKQEVSESQESFVTSISSLQLLGKILEVLCAYQQVLPSCLEQTSHDFTLMVHSVFVRGRTGDHSDEEKTVEDEGQTSSSSDLLQLQCHCLKFLMGFPAGRFRWFKEVKGEGTVMYRLLSELTSTTQPELHKHLTQLVNKLLLETCLFEHSPTEVAIWLDHLMTLDPTSRAEVVTFLQSCLTKTIRNPHPYNDRVADCVTAGQTSRQQHLHGHQAVVKSFSIEDIPEVTDVNMDPGEQTECDKSVDSDNWKTLWPDPPLPCSALLPVALEKFTQDASSQKSESIASYITNVSTTILHQQIDPLPLCLLLQQYSEHEGKPTSGSKSWQQMLKYSNHWLQVKAKKTPKKSPPSDALHKRLLKASQTATTFSSLLQAIFESSPQSLLHDEIWMRLMAKITELSVGQIAPAIRHVLLYLHTLLNMQSQIHGDTLIDVVDKHMALVLNIIDHAAALESNFSSKKKDTSIFPLYLTPQSKDHKVIDWDQLAMIILKHPLCLYWFQRSATEGETDGIQMDPEEAGKISSIMIGYVLKLISKYRIQTTEECLKEMTAPYAHKTFLNLKVAVDAYYALSSLNKEDGSKCDATADSLSRVTYDNKTENKMESDDQDTGKDQDLHNSDEEGSVSSYSSDGSWDRDHFEVWSPDLAIFSHLSMYANSEIVSKVVCNSLKQPDSLVQEGTDQDGVMTQNLTHLGGVICALSIRTREVNFQFGAQLCGLLQSTGCEEFGKTLLTIMGYNKKHVLLTTKEMLYDFLDKPTEVRAKVAEKMIKQSFAHHCHFEDWCLDKQGQSSLAENKVELLHVMRAYCDSQENIPSTEKGVAALNILWDVYWPWVSEWLAGGLTHIKYTSGTLCRLSIAFSNLLSMPKTTPNVVKTLLQRILAQCFKDDKHLTFRQMQAIRSMLYKYNDECIHTLTLALQLKQMTVLTNVQGYSGYMENLISDCHMEWSWSKRTICISHCPEFPQIWKEFIRQVLRNEYKQDLFHTLLSSLISKLYGDAEMAEKLLSLERLYQMIVSHSQFLPSLLEESNKWKKYGLIRVMLAIAKLEPSCCQTTHFAVMLGAYSASLHTSDCHLLALMNVYENNNAAMWEYRPYMWGPVAITQHASRKALGHNLWQQPTMREVLELMDPAKLHQSALKFPLDRKLQEPEDRTLKRDLEECYDPCFLLPLFSHLLAPESVADCKKFAECHALEYTLAALGSHDPTMRTAAYHVLSVFHQHIMGAKLMGKRELMYLIECLRNSIKEPNCRLPNVVALFIGRMATVMMSPSQHIYPVLIQFLTLKPQIQLTSVPMFNWLFHSTNLKHGKEREWMMQLLLEGLRDADDFQVYEKTGIFKTLLAFQLSVLCGETLNSQIFELLEKACAIPEAAHQLIRQHSLLTWIDAHINSHSNLSSLKSIITLLHILGISVLTTSDPSNTEIHDGKDQKEDKSSDNSRKDQSQKSSKPDANDGDKSQQGRCKLPAGSSELFFSICVRLLDYIKPLSAMNLVLLREYLQTLSAACHHKISTTGQMSASQVEQDGLPLRTQHVAQLLLLYSSVLEKKDLLGELASVSATPSTVNVREQAGVLAKSFSQKKSDWAGDYDRERCSQALVSIVTHWRPFTGGISGGKANKQKIHGKEGDSGLKIDGQNKEADSSAGKNEFVLFVMKWVLSTLSQAVRMTEDHWQGSFLFVKKIIDNSTDIQQHLLDAEALGKDITELLLSFSMGDTIMCDSFRRIRKDGVNQIFLRLVSHLEDPSVIASSVNRESRLVKAVRTTFKEPLEMCRKLTDDESTIDSSVSCQLTALLMQELWVGSDQPHHFLSAYEHCIGKKVEKKKKKRRSTDDGDGKRTAKKKKRHSTGR